MVDDMKRMYEKFGLLEGEFTEEKLWLRMKLLDEEYKETMGAYGDKNKEDWVDGHIDLITVAIGNLLVAGVDVPRAWKEVYQANMTKKRGVKKGRGSEWDITKDDDFIPPNHSGNYGQLDNAFQEMLPI